mgnify:CR=1 FL=1
MDILLGALAAWTVIGGIVIAIAGREILEEVRSELAGWTSLFLMGPVAWAIVFIVLLGQLLDLLVDKIKDVWYYYN